MKKCKETSSEVFDWRVTDGSEKKRSAKLGIFLFLKTLLLVFLFVPPTQVADLVRRVFELETSSAIRINDSTTAAAAAGGGAGNNGEGSVGSGGGGGDSNRDLQLQQQIQQQQQQLHQLKRGLELQQQQQAEAAGVAERQQAKADRAVEVRPRRFLRGG
jgi:hypothetical protein